MAESKKRKATRDKVRAYRERLRNQGLRPIQIWVPDVRSRDFKAEANRQSLAVAQSSFEQEDQKHQMQLLGVARREAGVANDREGSGEVRGVDGQLEGSRSGHETAFRGDHRFHDARERLPRELVRLRGMVVAVAQMEVQRQERPPGRARSRPLAGVRSSSGMSGSITASRAPGRKRTPPPGSCAASPSASVQANAWRWSAPPGRESRPSSTS